jgi:hypothetical protein
MRLRVLICAVVAASAAAAATATDRLVGSSPPPRATPSLTRPVSATTAAGPLPAVTRQPAAGPCGKGSARQDPIATAERFLETVVSRADPGRGFGLAMRDLRGRTTCQDWVEGRAPVAAYPGIDWTRSNYRTVTVAEGQVVLRVVLFSKQAAPAAFLMELRRDGGETAWRVGTWMPVRFLEADRQVPKAAPAKSTATRGG